MDRPRQDRRLAAILAADVVGYSRLVGADENGALASLKILRATILSPAISKYSGRLFKTMGDGFLVEFASAVQAVECAAVIQKEVEAAANEAVPETTMRLRIGIHLGDVFPDGDDLLGDGVNIAARLESIAAPAGIAISRSVHDLVRDRISITFEDHGEVALKNISRPIQVFAIGGISHDTAASMPMAVLKPALALPNKPSIAVLPFQNLSGDPEQDYFSDGIVEDLTAALSRVRSFFVIARNSSLAYKGQKINLKQISEALGVRYAVEGSVRKAGSRIRISAQLVDVTLGNQIWSDRYDGAVEEIFELQDNITAAVSGAIQPSILNAEIERTRRTRPDSLDAYDLVLRAFPHFWRFDAASNKAALGYLLEAIKIDPQYNLALSLAAWCYTMQATYLWTTEPDFVRSEALRLAKLAGETGSDDPLVLTMLGAAHSLVSDWDLASALIEKALVLDPNSAVAWNRSGWLQLYLMQHDRAIEHFQRAIRLSPFDPMNFNCYFGIGVTHMGVKRFDEALHWVRRSLVERPDISFPLRDRKSVV